MAGSHPHDVAPAPDGGVWYTGQHDGTLGHLDPATGDVRTIPLGAGSAPHGVITGPDGNAWITDGGLNAIVRVDAATDEVTVFPLPADRRDANLNTAVFDGDGILWFTGQAGIYGRLDPATGAMDGLRRPGGSRPVRHHGDAVRRDLVRLARRQPHRPGRPGDREGDHRRAADARPGRPPRLVRFPRAASG